jgi:hypothetical protein
MVPTTHLLAFTITALVLIAVPGPSVLFTVSRAIALGRVAGLATVAGNTAGAFTQVVAVAFGLGPLVERSVATARERKRGCGEAPRSAGEAGQALVVSGWMRPSVLVRAWPVPPQRS